MMTPSALGQKRGWARYAGLCPLGWPPEPPGPPRDLRGWQGYWETLSDRQQLFREQAAEYVRNLTAAVPLHPRMRVLDFGCGFGLVADLLAPKVGELYLWDASANMRRHARRQIAGHPNVRYLDLSRGTPPLGAPALDLVLVNSVVQYMAADEFGAWLRCWRDLLAPSGRVVVSDVIPPAGGSSLEFLDLLKFSARRGFLLRALWQAVRELGDYRKTRRANPLACLSREDLTTSGRRVHLNVAFIPRNLTHFPNRITAVFSHAAHGSAATSLPESRAG